MNYSNFIIALLLAIAPAIITSLIEGAGEWSNSRNYKKSKALDAIYSFRFNIGHKINRPKSTCYQNISRLSNHQLQLMVIYLNQWSVYLTDNIASNKVIEKAVGYELILCILLLRPTASKLNMSRDLKGYFELINYFNMNGIIKLVKGD